MDKKENPAVVQSVERTFMIIEELGRMPGGIALGDLSSKVGLHKSTVHRLLTCLAGMGYVTQDSFTGRYRLSLKLFEVAGRAVNSLDIVSATKPHLDRLSAKCGEAVHLVIRDGVDMIYVYKVDANVNSIRMSSSVGLRIPMYCTGVGKAVLAEYAEEEVKQIWETSDIRPLTANTITDLWVLQEQLELVRRRGYAVDDEENEPGVRCVAVALPQMLGGPPAAYSVSAPAMRMRDEQLQQIAEMALQAKVGILHDIGVSP